MWHRAALEAARRLRWNPNIFTQPYPSPWHRNPNPNPYPNILTLTLTLTLPLPLTLTLTLTLLAAQAQGLAGKQVGGSAAEVKAALRKAMWNPAPDLSKL